jgi:hypothetical protein
MSNAVTTMVVTDEDCPLTNCSSQPLLKPSFLSFFFLFLLVVVVVVVVVVLGFELMPPAR